MSQVCLLNVVVECAWEDDLKAQARDLHHSAVQAANKSLAERMSISRDDERREHERLVRWVHYYEACETSPEHFIGEEQDLDRFVLELIGLFLQIDKEAIPWLQGLLLQAAAVAARTRPLRIALWNSRKSNPQTLM